MKTLLFGLLTILAFGQFRASAEEDNVLPFPVTVGAELATHHPGTPFAKIVKAVKSDAPIQVGADDKMIIINVSKTNEKGEPSPGASPAVILLQGTNKGTLAGTMDKSKLAPGNYILSVVAGGKTATIQFKIE